MSRFDDFTKQAEEAAEPEYIVLPFYQEKK